MDPSLAALVARFVDGEVMDVRAECGRLGVSTKTFYKYRKRFLAEGVDGFFPRSRRPQHNPRATDPGVAEAVLLGVVVGLQRRASGGILGPILTHVTWSVSMLFLLPALFG